MGLVVMVVVLVQHRQVDQRVEVDRGRGADPLVQLDRLGVLGAPVVQHRQPERGHLMVGVLPQGPLVKLGGLLVVAVLLLLLPAAVELFRGPLVDRRHRHLLGRPDGALRSHEHHRPAGWPGHRFRRALGGPLPGERSQPT